MLERRKTVRRVPALDGLRAIAISLVVLDHYGAKWIPPLGVLISFVLSGFLITRVLLRESEQRSLVVLKRFLWRRALRTLPVFLLYWTVSVGLMEAIGASINVAQVSSSLFFVMDYYRAFTGNHSAQTWITWSLSLQEQFYLIWPLILLPLRNNLRRSANVLVGMIVSIWIYRIALVEVWHVGEAYIYNALETRCDALLIGCLVAIYLHLGVDQRWLTRLISLRWLTFLLVGVLVLCGYFTLHPPNFRFCDDFGLALEAVAIGLLIAQVTQQSTDLHFRWLALAPLRYLGSISYSLFFFHVLVHQGTTFLFPDAPAGIRFFGSLGGSLALAAFSFEFLEKSLQQLKYRPTLSRAWALLKAQPLISDSERLTTSLSWPSLPSPSSHGEKTVAAQPHNS